VANGQKELRPDWSGASFATLILWVVLTVEHGWARTFSAGPAINVNPLLFIYFFQRVIDDLTSCRLRNPFLQLLARSLQFSPGKTLQEAPQRGAE
jgi:hypothetical protein